MKILLDQNMPLLSAGLLRKLGHDAVHTTELGKARDTDPDLIVYASRTQSVIATRDGDFHEIIATQSLTEPSTILIRFPSYDEYVIAELVHEICIQCERDLLMGCLVTANGRNIGVHSLPLTDD